MLPIPIYCPLFSAQDIRIFAPCLRAPAILAIAQLCCQRNPLIRCLDGTMCHAFALTRNLCRRNLALAVLREILSLISVYS